MSVVNKVFHLTGKLGCVAYLYYCVDFAIYKIVFHLSSCAALNPGLPEIMGQGL